MSQISPPFWPKLVYLFSYGNGYEKPTSEDVINVRVPSMDSSSLDVLDSSNEDNIAPVANKRARLLPSSDDSTK